MNSIPVDIPVVIVGDDPGPLGRSVVVTREDPVFGGPVAALAAGVAKASTPIVALLAVDMPHGYEVATRLIPCLDERQVAVPIDSQGQWQQLISAYQADALRNALGRLVSIDGASVRSLLDHLDIALVVIDDELLIDIDTPDDLVSAEANIP